MSIVWERRNAFTRMCPTPAFEWRGHHVPGDESGPLPLSNKSPPLRLTSRYTRLGGLSPAELFVRLSPERTSALTQSEEHGDARPDTQEELNVCSHSSTLERSSAGVDMTRTV